MPDYGILSRTLHRLALDLASVGEASFDLDRKSNEKALSPSEHGKHVFVAGLARSGTTVLMRSLFDTGEFGSLTYRDMPFVLAPNTWAKLSTPGATSKDAKARAHGDGMLVDFDSPEALEEVFWRVFCGDRYIERDRLRSMIADQEDIDRFRTYVSLILKRYGVDRYLSKNNNNILRLESIRAIFPNALILIPYRAPDQQAYSLLKQHIHFTRMHNEDRFSRRYMKWLVHHEFGADHRPFEWGKALSPDHDTMTIDYWLNQWIGVYDHLFGVLRNPADNIFPVGYEMFCKDTDSVWTHLTNKLELDNASAPALDLRERSLPDTPDRELLERANELFEGLNAEAQRLIRSS